MAVNIMSSQYNNYYRDANCYAVDNIQPTPNYTRNVPQPLFYPCVLPLSAYYHCPHMDTAESCIRTAVAHEPDSPLYYLPTGMIDDGSLHAENVGLLMGGIKQWVRTSAYVLRVLNPTLIALAVIGNLLILSIIMQPRLRNSCNSFQISACLAAVLYGISLLLMRLGDYITNYDRFVVYDQGLPFIHHAHHAFLLIYIWCHVAIGFERCRSGKKTDEAAPGCASWAADLYCLLIWVCAAAVTFASFWFAFLGEFIMRKPIDNGLACPILFWLQLVVSLFIPYPLILFNLISAIRALRSQKLAVGKITLGTSGELWRQRLQEEIQWTRLAIAQFVMFLLLTTPFVITQFIRLLRLAPVPGESVCFWSTLIDLMLLGVLFYQSLQFVLFGCMIEKFALTFRSLCCGCLCPAQDEPALTGY